MIAKDKNVFFIDREFPKCVDYIIMNTFFL